jgi:hypothetical protein
MYEEISKKELAKEKKNVVSGFDLLYLKQKEEAVKDLQFKLRQVEKIARYKNISVRDPESKVNKRVRANLALIYKDQEKAQKSMDGAGAAFKKELHDISQGGFLESDIDGILKRKLSQKVAESPRIDTIKRGLEIASQTNTNTPILTPEQIAEKKKQELLLSEHEKNETQLSQGA